MLGISTVSKYAFYPIGNTSTKIKMKTNKFFNFLFILIRHIVFNPVHIDTNTIIQTQLFIRIIFMNKSTTST